MLTLGGGLKRKELLSARLGDVLSYLYLASMVLKHHRDQGEPREDLPLVEWACRSLLYSAQEQLHGLLRNFPNRFVAVLLRMAIFPRGRTFSMPSDDLGQEIVELTINPTATRQRLADVGYITPEPGNPLGLLQEAMEMAEAIKPIERRVFNARRAGEITSEDTPGQIDEAEQKGIVTLQEAEQLRAFDSMVMELTGVDDFDPAELSRVPAEAAARPRASGKTAKKKTKKKKTKTRTSTDTAKPASGSQPEAEPDPGTAAETGDSGSREPADNGSGTD